jgi:hypothetical protein
MSHGTTLVPTSTLPMTDNVISTINISVNSSSLCEPCSCFLMLLKGNLALLAIFLVLWPLSTPWASVVAPLPHYTGIGHAQQNHPSNSRNSFFTDILCPLLPKAQSSPSWLPLLLSFVYFVILGDRILAFSLLGKPSTPYTKPCISVFVSFFVVTAK